MRRLAIVACLLIGCGDTEWSDVRDPRVARAAEATIAAWEAEVGPVMYPQDIYDMPIGITSDICSACSNEPACDTGGCFGIIAIYLNALAPQEYVYGAILPHEYVHALQWFEQSRIDAGHTDDVWQTVLPLAQESL